MQAQPVEQVHELGRHPGHHRQQPYRQRREERCRCLLPGLDDHRLGTAGRTASSDAGGEAAIGHTHAEAADAGKRQPGRSGDGLGGDTRDGGSHRRIAPEVARRTARHEREHARLGDLDSRHHRPHGAHHLLERTGIAGRIVLLDAHRRAASLSVAPPLTNGDAFGSGCCRMSHHLVGMQHDHRLRGRLSRRRAGHHHRPVRAPQHPEARYRRSGDGRRPHRLTPWRTTERATERARERRWTRPPPPHRRRWATTARPDERAAPADRRAAR